MNGDEALQKSLSDRRIRQYQSMHNGREQILRSPDGKAIARTFGLDAFAVAHVYPIPERRRIVEQIRLVLRDYFVHLDMKRSQFGFDPVRALDRLEPVAAELSDEDFHQSILQVITRTRDRHLVFYGRRPNGVSAVLPFDIERCWIDDAETYVITRIEDGYSPAHLRVGAIVTHWNGTLIARQIRLNANLFDAGNEPGLLARAIEFLTQRPLARFAWPADSWVDLRFEVEGQVQEERFEWSGFDVGLVPLTHAIGRNVVGFGGDLELFQQQQTKRAQFARQSFDTAARNKEEAAGDGIPVIIGSKRNFDFGSVTTEYGNYGYFRLRHFRADGVDDIAFNVIDALAQIPQTGLVIDMRGNSGGYIAAGERLLQLFTPRRIVPTRFQFRVTEGTRRMMGASSYFERWRQSFEEAHLTGEAFSQGYPIEGTDEDANQLGQHYFGPVVVVTDALALSTADMFVAGFIDHQIGRVICIDKNMAAAGGNNWRFDVLRLFVPDFSIDHGFATELEAGTVSHELKMAFNENGTALSDSATVSSPPQEFGGRLWIMTDGALEHYIRDLSWMSGDLVVYPYMPRSQLQPLPDDLYFGLTIRRCVRTGPNEGRLLEDLGIRPDVIYYPTLRDVLGRNQDLLARAASELQGMPAYGLNVTTLPQGDDVTLTVEATPMSHLEIACDGKHVQSFNDLSAPAVFGVPAGGKTVVIKGYDDNELVARRVVTLF